MWARYRSRFGLGLNHRVWPAGLPAAALTAGIVTLGGWTLGGWTLGGATAMAQTTGYQVDPQTGQVYAAVTKTYDQPKFETNVVTRNETTYVPRTVTEQRPTTQTIYRQVVQGQWEPYVTNRWNPFAQPTWGYRYVARAGWVGQPEVVNQTTTRTEYVAEVRPVQRTEIVQRIVREQRTELQPVGTVAAAAPITSPAPLSPQEEELRRRLRPLASHERIAPPGSIAAHATTPGPRLASTTVAGVSGGRYASDPPQRSLGQGGIRATDLTRPQSIYGQPLPPVGVAGGFPGVFR